VAASFSAPVLFVIAQSLTDMQVLADIDEADVGKVREGMLARVSVDAFPGESFEGKVTQIRYSPTEIQGVVTYAAVLAVENAELKLRPGMTATVSVTTAQVEGRPAVKNAALRFKPSDPGSVGAPLDLDVDQRRVYVPAGEAAEKPAAEKPAASAGAGDASGPVAAAPELTPLVVRVGISDGVWTALESDELAVGAPVVVQERSAPGEERRKLLGIF
jgi:HlyD family secretion protein